MKSNQRKAVWPYLGVLACLFAVCVSGPRAWEHVTHRQPLAVALASRGAKQYIDPASQSKTGLQTSQQPSERTYSPQLAPEDAAPQSEGEPNYSNAVPAAPAAESPATSKQSIDEGPVAQEEEAAQQPGEPNPQPNILTDWPPASALLAQLGHLDENPDLAGWASKITEQVQRLCMLPGADQQVDSILDQLEHISESAIGLAAEQGPTYAATKLLRAHYALVRRLEIWRQVAKLRAPQNVAAASTQGESMSVDRAMSDCLGKIDEITGGSRYGNDWRSYVMLNPLRCAADESCVTPVERRAIARQALGRLTRPDLTSAQRRFVSQVPFVELRAALNRWTAEPVNLAVLLRDMEDHEQTDSTQSAKRLADDCRSLIWSESTSEAHLGKTVAAHYRNANLRVAVSSDFVNRFVPQPPPVEAPVRDTVLGAEVRGRSTTFSKLAVRLIPDKTRIRLGLEARGTVQSDTAATSGPATFYSSGQSNFMVRKLFVISSRGVYSWPAISQADNYGNRLISLETDYDGLPLISSLVRNMARAQHEDAEPDARAETERRVATRARQQFDDQVRPRVQQAEIRFRSRLLEPLERLALEPNILAMSTSAERFAVRVRLADDEQLGADTARPRALSDSQFSLQLHASALNNALEKLDLAGRKFSLPELYAWLARKLDRPELRLPDDVPDDVNITFATDGPVRVRCQEGRVELTLHLAKFSQGRNAWRDFSVQTYYRPEPQSRDARFLRDSAIYLYGEGLKKRPQILLRTIFTKILAQGRHASLIPDSLAQDPRMADLEISQFVVEEGWIGLSYAQKRGPDSIAAKNGRMK